MSKINIGLKYKLKFSKNLIRIYTDQLIMAGTTSSTGQPNFQTSRKAAQPAFDQFLNIKTFRIQLSKLRQVTLNNLIENY